MFVFVFLMVLVSVAEQGPLKNTEDGGDVEIRKKRFHQLPDPPLSCNSLDHRKLPPSSGYFGLCLYQSPQDHAQCRSRCDRVFGDDSIGGACIGTADPYPSDGIVVPPGYRKSIAERDDPCVKPRGTDALCQDVPRQGEITDGHESAKRSAQRRGWANGRRGGSYFGRYYKLDCVCRLCFVETTTTTAPATTPEPEPTPAPEPTPPVERAA